MKIEKPFTDEAMIRAIVDQLKIVTDRHGEKYNSAVQFARRWSPMEDNCVLVLSGPYFFKGQE